MARVARRKVWTVALAALASAGLISDRVVKLARESKPVIEPQLARCTLEVGRQSLKPTHTRSPGWLMHRVGAQRIQVEKDRVTCWSPSGTKPVWTASSPDKHHLQWLTHDGDTAYLQGYEVDAEGRFSHYSQPPRGRRLALKTGQWQADLPAWVGGPKAYKPEAVIRVLAAEDYLAVLSSLVKPPAAAAGEKLVAYAVSCYRRGKATPLWTRTFPAAGQRPGPGVSLG